MITSIKPIRIEALNFLRNSIDRVCLSHVRPLALLSVTWLTTLIIVCSPAAAQQPRLRVLFKSGDSVAVRGVPRQILQMGYGPTSNVPFIAANGDVAIQARLSNLTTGTSVPRNDPPNAILRYSPSTGLQTLAAAGDQITDRLRRLSIHTTEGVANE
jgi:hypothetical protein